MFLFLGIDKKKKAKLSWDEQLQKWIPLYGFKRAQAEKEKNWVLEVPQNADPNEDQFAKKQVAKSENVAKNELQRLRNIAKSRKIKVPRVGLTNPEVSGQYLCWKIKHTFCVGLGNDLFYLYGLIVHYLHLVNPIFFFKGSSTSEEPSL